MNILNYRSEILLFVILTVFTLLKLDSLHYNLYWDETIYLVPTFLENGFSAFFPKNYNPNAWHGHPPLFQILHYFLNQFTNTIAFSAHLSALISYYLFGISLFLFFKNIIGKFESLFLFCLVTLTPFIYAQSTMFHPNYLALGLGLLSLHYLSEKNFLLYSVFVSLAVLTRESTIAFAVSGLIATLYLIIKKEAKLKALIAAFVPVLIQVLHFTYNKITSENFIGHPYYQYRTENGFKLFSLENNYSTFISAISEATYYNWSPYFLYLLLILFIATRYKAQTVIISQVKLDKVFPFLLTASFYIIFFFLYADTIPRDLIIASILLTFLIVMAIKVSIKNSKISNISYIVISLVFFYENMNAQERRVHSDLTEKDQKIVTKTMFKISKYIDENYSSNTSIFIPWPGSTILQSQKFEYNSKEYKTTQFEKENNDLLVNSDALSNYRENITEVIDKNKWQLVKENKSEVMSETFQIFERIKR